MIKHCFEGANAVIVKDTKVLLQKRSDVPIWVIPGGEKERYETPKNAVVREVLEETGLKVTIERCVGTYHSGYLLYRDSTHVFLCKVKSGKLQVNEESLEMRFFPLNNLPKTLLFLHAERIMDAVAGKKNLKVVQKITFWKVLRNFRFNPVLLWKLFLFSVRKVF